MVEVFGLKRLTLAPIKSEKKRFVNSALARPGRKNQRAIGLIGPQRTCRRNNGEGAMSEEEVIGSGRRVHRWAECHDYVASAYRGGH
jgi:hypothetical protein